MKTKKKAPAAKRGAAKKPPKTATRRAAAPAAARTRVKRTNRASEETFPELGNLKDPVLTKHAKTYADEMFQSEQALDAATAEKQAIRSRMGKLKASLFTAHGYEFTRVDGEEKFTARKIKRGSKPADTVAHDEGAAGQPLQEEQPDFDTDIEGRDLGSGDTTEVH